MLILIAFAHDIPHQSIKAKLPNNAEDKSKFVLRRAASVKIKNSSNVLVYST